MGSGNLFVQHTCNKSLVLICMYGKSVYGKRSLDRGHMLREIYPNKESRGRDPVFLLSCYLGPSPHPLTSAETATMVPPFSFS
jgi:hypothetical protein